jgi:FkbM family methyltransferase
VLNAYAFHEKADPFNTCPEEEMKAVTVEVSAVNAAVRRFFQGTPILKDIYYKARSAYQHHRMMRVARGHVINLDEYDDALKLEDGKVVDVRMKDGLTISLRRDHMDAGILAEVFFDNCYVQDLFLPPNPVVVDIGGFIGDFALYAATRLKARRVVVCEPAPRNWTLLVKNIQTNHCEDRVSMVNKAVTDGRVAMLDIDAPDRGQARISAYRSSSCEKKAVESISLSLLLAEFRITEVDLLKIDCEGGEYDILLTTPSGVLSGVKNIVFEYHEIDGFQQKLNAVRERLSAEGFLLKTRGCLIAARRATIPA